MTPKVKSILARALRLSEAERADLAATLLESLEPELSPEEEEAVEEAWKREIAARVAQIEAGEAEMIPWEEVREELRAKLRSWRTR